MKSRLLNKTPLTLSVRCNFSTKMADGQKSQPPKGNNEGLRTVRTTSLFRTFNFELFARQNKYVMGFGLVALTGCVAYVAYLNAISENKTDGLYEEYRPDGTKEMQVKRSKWD